MVAVIFTHQNLQSYLGDYVMSQAYALEEDIIYLFLKLLNDYAMICLIILLSKHFVKPTGYFDSSFNSMQVSSSSCKLQLLGIASYMNEKHY